jgi:hypothetical protein
LECARGSGEGNNSHSSSSSSSSSSFSSFLSSSSSSSAASSVSNVSSAVVIDGVYEVTEEDCTEFLIGQTYAPLYACQEERVPIQLCGIMDINAPRPFTKQQASDDEKVRAKLAQKGYTVVPVNLTDEEKLLIAQEKRGKRVPDSDSMKKQLVEHAHLAGHFGEKAMLANIDRQGYWWPHIREDIAKEILHCSACQRHTITHHGYAPSQSIFSARPCDHYQMDVCQLPESREGWKFCLVVVDLFTGFVVLEPL